MEPDVRFWANKRVCVTGGTGFLGWQIVQQLLAGSARVRILGLRSSSPALQARLAPLDCIYGDIRDAAIVRDAVRDCDFVFHTAGTVASWGPSLVKMHEIHTVGTRNVIAALRSDARLVHTSSIVAVGATREPLAVTETSPFELQRLKVSYVHAKKAAEDIALEAAARGSNIVCVNPGYLTGPEDYEGSIIGQYCLRFWKNRVPLISPGGMSFVDVRDVARGHLLATERGQVGQRYILAGENLSMVEFALRLADIGGQSMAWRFRIPGWLQMLIACVAECRGYLSQRRSYPSFEDTRMTRYYWYASSERARVELGYHARTVRQSLHDAYRWLAAEGRLQYVVQALQPVGALESGRRESVACANAVDKVSTGN